VRNESGSLTSAEREALAVHLNLADAHARQMMTEAERAAILRSFPDLFDASLRRDYRLSELSAASAFLTSIGQTLPHDYVLASYASSITTMVVARLLRRADRGVSLTCPTFDNIHALLVGEGVRVVPRAPGELPTHASIGCVFEVSPNNPTGDYLDGAALADLAAWCAATDTWLVLDQSFKGHDPRACFDHYPILEASGCDYIVIEDTGKLWPTGDLKAAFAVVSSGLFEPFAEIHDDVLLNVAPFVLELVSAYSRFSSQDSYASIRDLIAANRRVLRSCVARSGGLLEVRHAESRVGVEMLRLKEGLLASVSEELTSRDVAVLDGSKFFWDGRPPAESLLRVSLCRDLDYFRAGAMALVQAVVAVG
jgi:aspartate/methionine/tyrosine aminotransferase